ncbi:uncharacterized protein BJ212DRAFT_1479916 [Suillus subaureus]|uniref:Transmembrane protein n=1 Tax=Suillus subaureus TaxID=48587 RepID=A0A9P7ECR9_9AGAM|nr:uncharacterized protein BJ212DRAFT_1479916 [Suillus subaureus]KAG1818089.1 hypothetical protein BJ212DRAFT_1479916 [Suillus subaureus]
MVLLLLQGLAICFFLHALLGLAEVSRSFSWDLTNHEFERVHNLTVCDGLHISLPSSLGNYNDIEHSPYTLLAFEAGGALTATQIHEDGLWQVKHPAGSQLLLALVDSLGNSGGVLPTVFTVASGSSDCLSALPTSVVSPMIITNASHIEPCDSWQMSVSGGVPPYTIMLASPGAPFLQDFAVPQESGLISFINSGIALRGPTIAAVRDSSGVFGHTTEFVEVVEASGVSCEVGNRGGQASRVILATRSNGGVKLSHQDTIIIAVCASVGGTMIFAALCFAVVKFRRRKRGLIAGQDARPRPFEAANPVPSANASVPRVNISVPLSVIDISWRNNWMASPTEASSTHSPVGPKPSPLRTPTRPLPVPTASRQPSNTSLRPEDPPSRLPRNPSSSYVTQSPQAGPSQIPLQQQSISSIRSANNSHRPANSPMSPQRSALAQEVKRFTPRSRTEGHERILHPSRSTGDIPRDDIALPSRRHHATVPRSTSDMRHTNHLRHYYSASNVARTDRGVLDPVHQHRDRGDPPPPYHKLGPLGK